jgi:hypothetical protein
MSRFTRPASQAAITAEVGAFKPGGKMSLLVFDLRPDIYRLSGIDAGDYVPIESRRFNGVLGWDLTVGGRRAYTDMAFQLDPVDAPIRGTSAFQPDPGSSDFFSSIDTLQVSRFASSAGVGLSLQPNRTRRPVWWFFDPFPARLPSSSIASRGFTSQTRP